MTVLVDTSIWVDYFRGRPDAGPLDLLLDRGEVAVCGPVVAELLAGTATEQAEVLWLALGSLPSAPIDDAGWRAAGEAAHELRVRGASVPLLDVVIAIAAIRFGAELWSRDQNFERVREVVANLSLHEPRA